MKALIEALTEATASEADLAQKILKKLEKEKRVGAGLKVKGSLVRDFGAKIGREEDIEWKARIDRKTRKAKGYAVTIDSVRIGYLAKSEPPYGGKPTWFGVHKSKYGDEESRRVKNKTDALNKLIFGWAADHSRG